MSYKTIYGTSSDDNLSTYDLNKSYPGYNGFNLYGGAGDDTLRSWFIGRSGIDSIFGEDGDDFMSASVYLSNYASAIFSGGWGTDMVYMGNLDLVGTFSRPSSTITEFTVRNSDDGSEMTVAVSDDVEFISFANSVDYLTEDLANGLIRTVDWDELYYRTYGENSDWYYKGLNTKEKWEQLNDGGAGNSSTTTETNVNGDINGNITVLTGGGQQMKGDQFLAIADTFSGTNKDDRLLGYGGPDSLTGAAGNDFIHGHWGRDNITGGLGNDELRGGDGGDTIYGGNGADVIWGGGHKNTLDAGINDSSVDQIFIHADASLYDLPRDGSYADSLVAIGYEDQIFIHGVDDSALSFGVASMPNDPSQTGIGIYANGVLEATVGGNFTADQVNAMTTGGFFA